MKVASSKKAAAKKKAVAKKKTGPAATGSLQRIVTKKKTKGQTVKKTPAKKKLSASRAGKKKTSAPSPTITRISNRSKKTTSGKTAGKKKNPGIIDSVNESTIPEFILEDDPEWSFEPDSFPRGVPPRQESGQTGQKQTFHASPKNSSRDPDEMDKAIRNSMSDLVMILLEIGDMVRLQQILHEYIAFIGDMNQLLQVHRRG